MGDDYFDRLASDPPQMWALALGRRLPGPQRLPGRPARHRRLEQLRPLELAGVRRGDRSRRPRRPTRRRRRPPTTGPRGSSATRSRSSRSSTGRAGRCRGRACSARARTASASSAWRDWRGRTDARAAARPLPRAAADRGPAGPRPVARARPDRRGRSTWTFGTPTADSTFGKGIVFSQPVTIDRPIGRVEILLDRRGRHRADGHRGAGRADRAAATLTYTLDTSGNDHIIPNTPIVAHWRVVSAGQPAEVAARPSSSGSSTPTTGSSGRRPAATSSGSTGTRATRRSAQRRSSSASDAVRETSEAARRDRDRPDRLLRLRRRRRRSTARSGRAPARTSAGSGPRRHPDAVRARSRRARSTTRWVAVRRPARVRPPRVRHGVEEPVPLPAALAQRGPRGLPERGLRVVGPGAVESAARDGTLIPLDGLTGQFPNGRGLLPRLRRERLGGRLHDPDLRPRRRSSADPLVRRRADRRRGVQGRARAST